MPEGSRAIFGLGDARTLTAALSVRSTSLASASLLMPPIKSRVSWLAGMAMSRVKLVSVVMGYSFSICTACAASSGLVNSMMQYVSALEYTSSARSALKSSRMSPCLRGNRPTNTLFPTLRTWDRASMPRNSMVGGAEEKMAACHVMAVFAAELLVLRVSHCGREWVPSAKVVSPTLPLPVPLAVAHHRRILSLST
jgi:hypothetical protein